VAYEFEAHCVNYATNGTSTIIPSLIKSSLTVSHTTTQVLSSVTYDQA